MRTAKRKNDADKQLRIERVAGKTDAQVVADVSLEPAASGSTTVAAFNQGTFGDLGLSEMRSALQQLTADVRKGDLSGPEAMLVAQAASLNAIFTELARRSAMNMGEYLEASEKYMRLALKAQAQCRATIETLSHIKNPPTVIARQTNISAGPQQVNNGAAKPESQLTSNQPNELLEHYDEQRVDTGATRATVGSDPTLVALGTGHGAENGKGQSPL